MTDDVKRTKILEKVVKLFNLGSAGRNDAEGEVLAAITKARELMAEYNISLTEIEGCSSSEQAQRIEWVIKENSAYTIKGTFATYDGALALAIDCICNTKTFTRRLRTGHVSRIFAGTESDIAAASALFMILLQGMRRAAREHFGPGWKTPHVSYCNAYAIRVHERASAALGLRVSKEAANCLALVVRGKESALENYFEDFRWNKARDRKWNFQDPLAASLGRRDGDRVDLERTNRLSSAHATPWRPDDAA